MYNIGDFFKRIQNARAGSYILQQIIVDAVKKVTGIEVLPANVTIKSTTVTLGGISQAARSEIFIKREAILKGINEVQGKKITEIR
jgi:hypothetical protein